MTCPFRALAVLLGRSLFVGLLVAAAMSDRDDDPLASPLDVSAGRWHNAPDGLAA